MKLRLLAAALALGTSVAQAEVVPSFNDHAPLDTAPNVAGTVIVKQIPQPSFLDAGSVAYGVVADSAIYEGSAY
jgi:hypothetical protein